VRWVPSEAGQVARVAEESGSGARGERPAVLEPVRVRRAGGPGSGGEQDASVAEGSGAKGERPAVRKICTCSACGRAGEWGERPAVCKSPHLLAI
jgi:hypothetical protein